MDALAESSSDEEMSEARTLTSSPLDSAPLEMKADGSEHPPAQQARGRTVLAELVANAAIHFSMELAEAESPRANADPAGSANREKVARTVCTALKRHRSFKVTDKMCVPGPNLAAATLSRCVTALEHPCVRSYSAVRKLVPHFFAKLSADMAKVRDRDRHRKCWCLVQTLAHKCCCPHWHRCCVRN